MKPRSRIPSPGASTRNSQCSLSNLGQGTAPSPGLGGGRRPESILDWATVNAGAGKAKSVYNDAGSTYDDGRLFDWSWFVSVMG
jgi:hypothetical protein